MPGKPGQSKLSPYAATIKNLLHKGLSYRKIAQLLSEQHGIAVSHNAVYSFVNGKRRKQLFRSTFLDGLDEDLRHSLMEKLVAEWTHESTALEGNTLSLGETLQVLQYGLTIHGKPVKDHEEVHGHAQAIDLLQELTTVRSIQKNTLFDLHKAIMPKVPIDVFRPVGGWKQEYNGVNGMMDGSMVYMEYTPPSDVPPIMEVWINEFNSRLDRCSTPEKGLEQYLWIHTTLVRIHPFFDGNGRLARLIANLPVLRGGLPPIMVFAEHRQEYIGLLWEYQQAVGQLRRDQPLLPPHPSLDQLTEFFRSEWERVSRLVDEAHQQQRNRD